MILYPLRFQSVQLNPFRVVSLGPDLTLRVVVLSPQHILSLSRSRAEFCNFFDLTLARVAHFETFTDNFKNIEYFNGRCIFDL